MATGQLGQVLRRLGRRAAGAAGGAAADTQLLERFVTARDEAAFEVLLWRHGPLVLGLCRRLLRHEQDAEDAFQATFLALARRAAGVRRGEALGAWLYRVAYRAALHLRATEGRLAGRGAAPEPAAPDDGDRALLHRELQQSLAEEIDRLPDRYRAAFVLCCLDGRTHEEAARQLGCPPGTVASRLTWARQRLRARLTRRGLAPAVLLTAPAGARAAVPPSLLESTVEASLRFAAGRPPAAPAAVALAEGVLRTMSLARAKNLAALVLACALLGSGAVGVGRHALGAGQDGDESAEIVPGRTDALRLSPAAEEKWGIQTVKARARPAAPRTLRLHGSLTLDPDRVLRVRSRFSGEVIQIGTTRERGPGGDKERPLRYGDAVKKGQVLAVVRCKELGEKKGELVDALVRLWADEAQLRRLENLAEDGAVSEVNVRTQRALVANDRNAAARAERTLRAWHVPEEFKVRDEGGREWDAQVKMRVVSEDEIKALVDEAKRAFETKGRGYPKREADWGRVEVRAPADGTVVEKNVNLGEVLDVGTDLFKLADVGILLAIVSAHEEDLAALRALPEGRRRWMLRVAGEPDRVPTAGAFDRPAALDPESHTATITGRVSNARGELRVGQLVTATVELPAAAGLVVVPASALVEEEGAFYLFVQPDPAEPVYCQRRVRVVRRGGGEAHLPAEAVRPGERVVTSGGAGLRAALLERRSR